jgi:hypothetical protein
VAAETAQARSTVEWSPRCQLRGGSVPASRSACRPSRWYQPLRSPRTARPCSAVAEPGLAGPQHRRTGEIKRFVCPGGFRTATEPDLRVDGGDLIAGDLRLPIDGRTADELAPAARLMRNLDHAAPETVLDFFTEGRTPITNPEDERGL